MRIDLYKTYNVLGICLNLVQVGWNIDTRNPIKETKKARETIMDKMAHIPPLFYDWLSLLN